MIAAKLVVGATVGRSKVEVLEFRTVRLNAERDPDETSRIRGSSLQGSSGHLGFDDTILKIGVRENRQPRILGALMIGRGNEVDGTATTIGYDLGSSVQHLEVFEYIRRKC
jgi:hypothetical protein